VTELLSGFWKTQLNPLTFCNFNLKLQNAIMVDLMQNRHADIVVVGSINADIFLKVAS